MDFPFSPHFYPALRPRRREQHVEARATLGLEQMNRSTMVLKHLLHERKTETGTLSSRRHEGSEELRQYLGRDARACILHTHPDPAALDIAQAPGNAALAFRVLECLKGVAKQVAEYLL